METLTLLFDTFAVMVVVYFSIKNEKAGEGSAEIGLFRVPAPKPVPPPAKAPRPPGRRSPRR